MMNRRLLGWLLLSVFPALAADGRLITQSDLYEFQWVADPQISPDGALIAYTHVQVNAKKDGYETALYAIPAAGGAPRFLTAGPRDSSPRWSPDGRFVAFVRSAEKDGKPQPPQICLLPMQGGEARALTDLPKGAGAPVWSPDGRSIAFTSSTLLKDFDKKKEGEPEPSDVRVILHAAYRSNGGGYSDPERPAHIWTVAVPEVLKEPVKAKQITQGEFAESDPTWAPDGKSIYFTSNRVREPYFEPPDSDIYRVSAEGGAIERVVSIDGPIRGIALNPAGTRVAFVGYLNKPVLSYNQPDLWVAPLDGGPARNLTAKYDFDISGGLTGDQRPPRGGGSEKPEWSADGRSIFVISAEQGRANLKRVNAETGAMQAVTDGDHDLFSFSLAKDKAAVLISTAVNIGDIFALDLGGGAPRKLTGTNGELFGKLNLTPPVEIWYQSFDGRKIQAWVQRPPDFQKGKKYPLILNIHGGPHAAYGSTFSHEFQWMAAKGYLVLYPNPRGSSNYGQEFGNIIQYRYPGDDARDLLAGVDELIRRGWADPDRLGVTGGSGGGVLTNWIIGQTQRFKAAVSQRSIADWRDFWYTADFTLFTPSWFRGAPWEQEADFKARSPITFVDRVTTPLMLVEGEADLRTPPAAGGEQMFRALRYRRVPVVMVQFPGESHELSRSGKPRHRVERLEHIVNWMDKYVLGKEVRQYDLAPVE